MCIYTATAEATDTLNSAEWQVPARVRSALASVRDAQQAALRERVVSINTLIALQPPALVPSAVEAAGERLQTVIRAGFDRVLMRVNNVRPAVEYAQRERVDLLGVLRSRLLQLGVTSPDGVALAVEGPCFSLRKTAAY